jgi:hypothetical protein
MKPGPPDTAVLAKWLHAAMARAASDASEKDGTGEGVGQVSCGEFDIRIAADGTWFYHGSPIGRRPLVRLFSSVLYRDEAGDYWLVTPVEQGQIRVDDAPFTAVEVVAEGAGRDRVLRFRTNLDDWVAADAEHPIRVAHNASTGEPRPYILVRGRLEARLVRPVFYELVDLAEERTVAGVRRYGVCSKGVFFPLDQPPGRG